MCDVCYKLHFYFIIFIWFTLIFQSQKHPALARRVIIVHLTGQKFEVFVDPCLTGRQLFDAVVTQTALDDFSFFGLTYLCGQLNFLYGEEEYMGGSGSKGRFVTL